MTQSERSEMDLLALTEAARKVIVSPGRASVITNEHRLPEIDPSTVETPDLQLFHFGFSICSQKVRAVLDELGLAFGSNQYAGPIEYENYTPEYVRLRLASEVAQQARFVSSYSGGSSVESEGFDPLVVPTLVDTGSGKILADSKLICLHLTRQYRDRIDLLPEDLEAEIMAQIDHVDRTPHVAMLYGANPDHDTRPEEIQARMPGIYQKKYKKIADFMARVADEPELIAAYEAKLAKERAAEGFVVDAEAMSAAIALSEELVQGLEDTLTQSQGPWIFGDRFTLADIFWGVSLIRLAYLGNAGFWGETANRPNVRAYYDRIIQRPCLIHGVLTWPGSGRRMPTS
ncbi:MULTISPECIES: glutathione S-transferase [unclassified Roseobacter]|uniref:glutathione S-transferase family protein n=1 Tax=unclassified Roseobacter TaxID=196798 RepID=UPI001C0EADD9